MCKNEKRTHGTAATGVPVAEMLASEARQPRTRGGVSSAYGDPSLCLFPGDRSRESCGTLATPSNDCFAKLGAYVEEKTPPNEKRLYTRVTLINAM